MTTPDTIAADIANAEPGATLVLEPGVYLGLPLKYRKPNLTIDCTNAMIMAQVRTADFDGLHLIGGTYKGGISLSSGKNFSLTGGRIEGTDARAFNGLGLQLVAGAKVKGVTFRDVLNGIVLSEVTDFEIDDNDIERARKDVINVFASQRGKIRRNKSRDQRPMNIGLTNADHPDAVQMFSIAGKPAVQDLDIEDNDFDIHHGQGITQTWKVSNGDPRFARIAYRRNRVKAGQPYGYGMLGVDGGILEDNILESYDDATYPVRFVVHESCTDIVWIGDNLQAPSKGQAAVAWPATFVPPPPPPADPRIAELEAEVEGLKAELADRDVRIIRQADLITSLKADVAALETWKANVVAAVSAA